ncbi:hypothetical protein Q9233_014064 [Columba guinea]|nr:hypothetical protein Q9233_014064 [Columba guinea]
MLATQETLSSQAVETQAAQEEHSSPDMEWRQTRRIRAEQRKRGQRRRRIPAGQRRCGQRVVLQKDYEKFSSALANLQQDRQQEQNDIKALSQALGRLKKQKADKEQVLVLGIDEKADKAALADKVSRSQFEACVERLTKMMEEVTGQGTGQEKGWHQFQRELQRQMDCKKDAMQLSGQDGTDGNRQDEQLSMMGGSQLPTTPTATPETSTSQKKDMRAMQKACSGQAEDIQEIQETLGLVSTHHEQPNAWCTRLAGSSFTYIHSPHFPNILRGKSLVWVEGANVNTSTNADLKLYSCPGLLSLFCLLCWDTVSCNQNPTYQKRHPMASGVKML